MAHQSNTGNTIIDLALNGIIWVLVGLHKAIAAGIVYGASLIFHNNLLINLSGLNEGLHTVALLLAIIVSTATIFKMIINRVKSKKP